jgi:phosphohistidine phosphatase SixA
MHLLLMRHGEASNLSLTDQERPLTLLGRQQVQQQAAQAPLQWQDFRQILTSPYKRTHQTANLLSECARQQGLIINVAKLDLITPTGQCDIVKKWLLDQPDKPASALMLVTHQPFISHFIQFLMPTGNTAHIPMYQASMALLSGTLIESDGMQLVWVRHV